MAHHQAARQVSENRPESTEPHRRPWLWVAAVVVLVAAVLLLVRPVDRQQETATASLPGGKSTVLPIDREATHALQRPGDEARALVARIRSGEEPYDLDAVAAQAAEYQGDGQLANALLLYFFAAREGHTPSAMALGSMYDPAHFRDTQTLMDEPDPVQAQKWYQIAAEGGESEGSARLDALKAWAEERARAGDESAQRLLLGWR
jgi:TPR repeat protein